MRIALWNNFNFISYRNFDFIFFEDVKGILKYTTS